ncbi:GTP-binding protein RAD-like [Penaeus indicus]|uniref:GTP-binding protein RAD-like n=1 Tax=Penaeus indicus TaxID=29960 RepID=UPI00300C26FA
MRGDPPPPTPDLPTCLPPLLNLPIRLMKLCDEARILSDAVFKLECSSTPAIPQGNEETGRGAERSVSVVLEGEEAELVFIRLQEITQAIAREGHADGWVVVYAINDRESFKTASTVLGRVWSLGHVTQRAVILVANKTDLQRTRVVTTSEGRTLAMTYECKFIEVSAGIDHNVDELLVGILTQVVLWESEIRLKNQVLSSENQEAPGSAPEGSPTATQQRTRHKNSFRVKGILNKLLNKDRKTKSCENLHVFKISKRILSVIVPGKGTEVGVM